MSESKKGSRMFEVFDACGCLNKIELDDRADVLSLRLGDVEPEQCGRIVELSVLLRRVRPGKRVALGIALSETDEKGVERPRGVRTLIVPANDGKEGRDVLVRRLSFVLAEEAGARCGGRRLVARVTAHYIDPDEASACALPG